MKTNLLGRSVRFLSGGTGEIVATWIDHAKELKIGVLNKDGNIVTVDPFSVVVERKEELDYYEEP